MRRVFCCLLTGLLCCGCGGAPEPAQKDLGTGEAAAIPEPEPPREAAWEEQLAAVQAGTSTQIRLTSPVSAEQFAALQEGCEGLTVLQLGRAEIDDESLALLPQLLSLRQLVLESPVGDRGMEYIASCPALEIVNLPRGTFSNEGLAALRALPLLTLLRFGSPQVTDAGMESLTGLPNLRFLHVIGTPITDDGLEPLKRIPLLESFYIDGGRCSDAGLSCLLQAVPRLHLHVNQLHLPGDAFHDPAAPRDAPAPP